MKTINLKRPSIIFAVFFAISLFFSCNREEDYEDLEFYPYALHGYVTDYHTGKPLANVTFDIVCGQRNIGMQLPSRRFEYKSVAKSDSKGYYKIRIPKGNRNMEFNVIFPYPQDISGYNFDGGDFNSNVFDTTAIMANISAISYGYLKVISSNDAIYWLRDFSDNYSNPRYKNKLISSGEYNDSLKFELYTVAAHEGIIDYFKHDLIYFTIDYPRDTILINLGE
ncbi:MAG: hypothetical protein ACK5MH_01170 [Bacteroidales bacterium]